ncbi:MAG: class I SAM-dependent methyltransferase [Rubrivivax sp.]|nr:class I SAM-dependent methyltransferase [Rubrivivax sp.]
MSQKSDPQGSTDPSGSSILSGSPGSSTVVMNRIRAKWRELGLFGLLGLVPKNLQRLAQVYVDRQYDRRHGVKTAGYTHLHELMIDNPNKAFGIRYQPTTEKRMAAMFRNLPKDLSEFTFVDFGSGRGRVLLFAAQFNFKRIVGVEFSEELHRSALENVAVDARRLRRCDDIQPLHQDATTYELPEGPLVLYFFDPFRGPVMEKVLDNIRRSCLASRRKIYLMYLAPVHEEDVEATGVFRRVATPPLPHEYSLPSQYRFAMWETDAPHPAQAHSPT